MSDDNYLIRESEKNEAKDVLALLKKNYLYKENIHQSYISNHTDEFSQEEKQIFESDVTILLEHLISTTRCLVVEHRESKKIVGSLLLEHVSSVKATESKSKELNQVSSKILREIFSYLEVIYKNSGFFAKFAGVPKILHFKYLCVDEDHKQKNLSTRLVREGVKWGREMGYDVAYGLFSSAFSKKAAANAGLKSVYDCDLREFRDSRGLSNFADVGVHSVVSVMAIDLKN